MKLYNYQECLESFGTRSRIDALVRSGELFRVETGFYADRPDVPEVDILLKRYPGSILTMESAYYYYDLSDNIPDLVHLATRRNGVRITDARVKQYFMPDGTLGLGETSMSVDDSELRIYDKERTLIETVRFRSKLPHDLYKEVIGRFREISGELYPAKMTDYLEKFPRQDALLRVIESEVF